MHSKDLSRRRRGWSQSAGSSTTGRMGVLEEAGTTTVSCGGGKCCVPDVSLVGCRHQRFGHVASLKGALSIPVYTG
ncbi:hypothetical protein C0Q70_09739 [Pomacea canaliculata]|uniref:Uncharacterized protein n=1 Tax=Pomacea canaliculata TaxID=400727 RepID=A0A2T7PAN3_POMCA|nr:hypothetical protein C0Q70_09739 [Pomacea canaliculata]